MTPWWQFAHSVIIGNACLSTTNLPEACWTVHSPPIPACYYGCLSTCLFSFPPAHFYLCLFICSSSNPPPISSFTYYLVPALTVCQLTYPPYPYFCSSLLPVTLAVHLLYQPLIQSTHLPYPSITLRTCTFLSHLLFYLPISILDSTAWYAHLFTYLLSWMHPTSLPTYYLGIPPSLTI